jgi:hypothetical protein
MAKKAPAKKVADTSTEEAEKTGKERKKKEGEEKGICFTIVMVHGAG